MCSISIICTTQLDEFLNVSLPASRSGFDIRLSPGFFRQIARQSYVDWPVYDSTLLYDRASLNALESDVRVVAETWFRHNDPTSVEQFVCSLPLAR